MDGAHSGAYYISYPQNRRKKIQVTTTTKVDNLKKNYYNQQNPYSLAKNPSAPVFERPLITRESSTNRDSVTQSSSERSSRKLVRANGLARVQKPNISSSRVSAKGKSLDSNYNNSQPIFQNGFTNGHIQSLQVMNHCKPGINQIHPFYMNQQLVNFSHLQQQNTNLRLENIRLKQQMLNLEMNHSEEVSTLKQHIQKLFGMARQLEEQITNQNRQWQKFQSSIRN